MRLGHRAARLSLGILVATLGVVAHSRAATRAPEPRMLVWEDDKGHRLVMESPSETQIALVNPQTKSCLTLDIEGVKLTLEVPGPILQDRKGRMVWTSQQLAAIAAAAPASLYADTIGDALSHLWAGMGDGPTPFPVASDGFLAPKCNQCLNGNVCTLSGVTGCCSGTGGCESCKFCGRSIDPEDP